MMKLVNRDVKTAITQTTYINEVDENMTMMRKIVKTKTQLKVPK